MQKVVKFGGSSLANAIQFKKVKGIIESDESRKIVVVSALGKRNKEDHKITDLLYLTCAHLRYSVDALSVFDIVKKSSLLIFGNPFKLCEYQQKSGLRSAYYYGNKVEV